MNYPLLIALGLMFLALVQIIIHPTGRVIAATLSAVLFALAVVAAITGTFAGLG